jgi:hypothetical protein
MAWIDAIKDIVSRYSGAPGGVALAPQDLHQDFESVANAAPREVTADALWHAFRSDRAPGFPQMLSTLFQASNPEQRAGVLNQLIGSAGPSVLAGIPALNELAGNFEKDQKVTPEQATQVSGDQVQEAAQLAERTNPSVVDQISTFYSAHPGVVKALGATAVTLMLNHISRRA